MRCSMRGTNPEIRCSTQVTNPKTIYINGVCKGTNPRHRHITGWNKARGTNPHRRMAPYSFSSRLMRGHFFAKWPYFSHTKHCTLLPAASSFEEFPGFFFFPLDLP